MSEMGEDLVEMFKIWVLCMALLFNNGAIHGALAPFPWGLGWKLKKNGLAAVRVSPDAMGS